MILNEIKHLDNPPINDFLNIIQQVMLNELQEFQLYSNIKEWRTDCDGSISEMLSELKGKIREHKYTEACAEAIPLMLRLSNEYESKKNAILSFENKNNLSRLNGILSDIVNKYVLRYNDSSITGYVKKIIKQVMTEHTMVALSKMIDNKDPRKFIIENGHIILVEQRFPNETSPRIRTMYTFLRDMKYLTNDGELTDIANLYIDKRWK
jgi:hypothetical protein